MNNANPYEYKYDQIGNLTQNLEDGIADIEWNIYGKVEKVTKTPDPFGIQATIDYRYDGTGNRIMKKVTTGATRTTTTYLRDASGNVMAIYEDKTDQTLVIKEIPIYGSSRLGQYRPKTDAKKTALGQRIYEFSNHLGNVLVTLTDNKVPQTDGTYESVVLSASDYYPFGMAMSERTYSNSEYRYGFNGQEQSDELDQNGNSYTAEFWQYSASIGRRWNLDPVFFPSHSPYSTFLNNPIRYNDPSGDCPTCPNNGKIGDTHIWAGETFTFDGTDWSMELKEVVTTSTASKSTETDTSGSQDWGRISFGGTSTVTLYDSYQRGVYKNTITRNAMRGLEELKHTDDLKVAEGIARKYSQMRQDVRTSTQNKLSPGGKQISKAIEQSRHFDDLYTKYKAPDDFDTYAKIVEKSGASNGSLKVVTKWGKRAGVVGTVITLGVSTHTVVNAPENQRSKVIAQETGGFLGGAVVGSLATAGAVGLTVFLVSNPAGWVIIGVGAVGGIVGGYYGDQGGRAIADYLFD